MTFKQLFTTLIFILFFQLSMGQSLSDIQNLKVDNLSDAQIEQLIKRAEASGMNEMQLTAAAAERGMPISEVTKLRRRIEELRSGKRTGKETQAGSVQLRNAEGFNMDQSIFDSLRYSDPYYDLTPTQKKIFGFKLFHNRDLTFNPSLNIPTPQTYVIGAGDQLLIDVYGASQESYDATVGPEGKILIANVGPIEVGGATIQAATARIKTSLTRIYSGMGGSNPNTFVDIRLGNIRSISVSMVGELSKPGNYILPSFASVFNALFAAGGPNENGSFRKIQVYRNNKLLAEVDVYDFLTKGNSSKVMLKDNDVVIVQPIQHRVEIKGPVRREGLFEIKQGENIEDLLRFSGGFSSLAYKERITVRRTTKDQMSVEDISSDKYRGFYPKDGDEFTVGEILNRFDNRVQISGAVYRPGEYSIPKGGMGVKELVSKAEGLMGDAFLNRAILYRTKDDLTLEATSVDIQGIIEGSAEDIQLRREDVLSIPSRYDLKEDYYIKISGEVNQTGAFAYGENMTVADLVMKAGGFKESASNSYIEIARRVRNDITGKVAEIINLQIDSNLKIKPEDSQYLLQPFDHVFIRRSPGFQREKIIKVEGEVFFPGDFALSNANERISDLIKRAGGINQFAYSKGATLIRRTEYYKGSTENEIKEENLTAVRERLENEDIKINEAEKILLERISKKLDAQELERLKEQKKIDQQIISTDFRADRLQDLSTNETSGIKIELKEQELVGINLEFILANPGSSNDLILQEGDIISIPKELQTVRMRGQVLFPTTARYMTGRGFKAYISKSGGFSEEARRSKSYVVYANGDVKRTRRFMFVKFYPQIEPGAEIIVPQKPERTPLGPQQWVSIGTGLATLGLVITQIVNLTQ
ncbi:SLBB domain-containing protein [Rhodonellum psychrophilum]|nr:SLBB domain-containing protein [Rhodonellum psychrophilum]SDZ05424.1 protein involved in polysaccharide export, contains SLBB domain of the beta-grasp fold [Rhodonellum ikkaensis]